MENPALAHPPSLPSIFDHFERAATLSNTPIARRRMAFRAGLAAIPASVIAGRLLGTKRAGWLAGSVAAIGLGALRWQLARWFTETPAYEVLGPIGDLELRRYAFRIEARTETDAADFDTAIHRGFGRLACYAYGANRDRETLEMTTPFIATMRDGVYATALTMPPHRPVGSLPHPDDHRVELREVPARTVAVLPFRGRFTQDNVDRHEHQLLRALVDAGLVARGSVSFAAYDSPSTLPMLRRNELWIDVM